MRIILTIAFAAIYVNCLAQGSYLPLNGHSIHLLDRFEIKSGRLATPQEFSTSNRSFQRNRIAAYVDSFNVTGSNLSGRDYFNLAFLQYDNFEFSKSESSYSKRKFLGLFKRKSAALSLVSKDFNLVANPTAFLQMGYDNRSGKLLSINNRGIEIRGTIGSKLGFYTSLNDEIITLNSWVFDFYLANKAIPGAGFLKNTPVDSVSTPINHSIGTGYLVYQPSKYFDVQFGHGKNFLGNGFRTFYMSDFSRDQLFLRVNTRIWKINYTNIWGTLYDWVPPTQRVKPKRHYYATTYANVNVSKSLNIGLFQTISFHRDSTFGSSGYELEYLNPIIFYKPIENGLNSPDKSIIGADFKWNFLRHFQLYGQFVLSELKVEELFSTRGWFGNKWASQFGIKYIDAFGIKNLDLQSETNVCRPYMYTSFNPKNAYVNFNQNMAHPLGANFYEQIGIIRFQMSNRVWLKASAIYAVYGNDTNGSNWGKDIRRSYEDKSLPRVFGNRITQGVKTNLLIADVLLSYMIKHNLFLDLSALYRTTKSDMAIFNTETVFVTATFRWNFGERRWDF